MAKILFFGRLGDASPSLDIALPDFVKNTADLTVWLSENSEALKEGLSRPGNRIAVNKTMIMQPVTISDADEIAFMSPLSGG